MDWLCTFFARAGKERPPMTGSSSSETPRKRKAPPPTLPSVEQDVQQRTAECGARRPAAHRVALAKAMHHLWRQPHEIPDKMPQESPFRSNQPPANKENEEIRRIAHAVPYR